MDCEPALGTSAFVGLQKVAWNDEGCLHDPNPISIGL